MNKLANVSSQKHRKKQEGGGCGLNIFFPRPPGKAFVGLVGNDGGSGRLRCPHRRSIHTASQGDEGATIESLRQQQAEQAKQRTVDVNKRLAAMGVKSGDILFYKRGDVETIFCVQKSEAGMLDATSYSNNIKTFWGNDEYVEEGVNIVPDGGIEHTTLFSRAIWELSDYYEAQEKLDPRDR